MQLLELILRDLVRRPADDETLLVRRARLRDNVEVDMADLLVGELAVVLHGHGISGLHCARKEGQTYLEDVVVLRTDGKRELLRDGERRREVIVWKFVHLLGVVWSKWFRSSD